MTPIEAYDLLRVCGVGKFHSELWAVAEVDVPISHTDGTRDRIRLNLAPGTVVGMAEQGGKLDFAETAAEVEVLALLRFREAKEEGGHDGALESLRRAIVRAHELEAKRLERDWHERAYLSN